MSTKFESSSDSDSETLEKKPKRKVTASALENLKKAQAAKKLLDADRRVATKTKKKIISVDKQIDNVKKKYEKLSGKEFIDKLPEPEMVNESSKIEVEIVNHPKVVKKVATIKKVKPEPVQEIKSKEEKRQNNSRIHQLFQSSPKVQQCFSPRLKCKVVSVVS